MFQGRFSKFMPFRTRGIQGYPAMPHSTKNSKKKFCARVARAHIFAWAQFFEKKKKKNVSGEFYYLSYEPSLIKIGWANLELYSRTDERTEGHGNEVS